MNFRWNLNAQDCAKHISKFSLKSTPLHSSCPHALHSCEKEEFESHYRSLNGLCNNPGNYIFGKSFSSYKRLLPSHYKDGIQEPRRSVHQRFDLPSPRLISTSICNHRDIVDKELTLAVMQWSQFIQHDLSHTATRKMGKCNFMKNYKNQNKQRLFKIKIIHTLSLINTNNFTSNLYCCSTFGKNYRML